MPKSSLNNIINPSLTMLRLIALDNTKRSDISYNDITLICEYDSYCIRIKDKEIHLNYSPYFLADIELIYQLITFGMDISLITSRSCLSDSELANVQIVNPDITLRFILDRFNDIKMYNFMHWNMTDSDINTLHTITMRLKDCVSFYAFTGVETYETSSNALYEETKKIDTSSSNYILPAYLSIACTLNETERKYFISDLNSMSDIKLNYYTKTMQSIVFEDCSVYKFAVNYIKNTYNYISEMLKKYPTIHKNIVDSFPNCIDKFPFRLLDAYIPSISTFPQTRFQWLLTNLESCVHFTSAYSLAMGVIPNGNTSENIKEATKHLLPYITCEEKAFELYADYMHFDADSYFDFIDSVSGKNIAGYLHAAEQYGYDFSDTTRRDDDKVPTNYVYTRIQDMLRFIEDGKEIYKMYPEPVTLEDGYVVRLSPVEGTLLKQVRNSIFNHREEQKISIEEKMKILHDGERMHIDVSLPNSLEQYRIKYKKHMIYSGKELGHCIGSKTESKHLYFRKGNVCAEVSHDTNKYNITMCYDKKNQVTDDSKEFKVFLETELAKLNVNESDIGTTKSKNAFDDLLIELGA